MLKLLIIRHGNALKSKKNEVDFERKLSNKGITQVNHVGSVLKNEGLFLEKIISSSAIRTKETTEIINQYLTIGNVQFEDKLYLADRDHILDRIIRNGNSVKTLLLVGHNFGLSDFVNHLSGSSLLMSTSMLIEIHFNFDNWAMLNWNTGVINRIIEP